MHVVYGPAVSLSEVHLALLLHGPRHGYEVKKEHDTWFPDARPLAFGQVYATLARLVRDGLAEVVETRSEGGPERTVYAVTSAGQARLDAWLAEPALPAATGAEDIVRKTVVALRAPSSHGARDVVLRQRAAHLRRMRELQAQDPGPETAAHLARRHALLHLDADLRWLDEAVDALAGPTAAAPAHPAADHQGAVAR
jgi:DNA-binding PadR family transcriptional regulator